MKRVVLTLISITLVICTYSQNVKTENTCNFFLIKEQNTEVTIQKEILRKGETRLFAGESLLSYVMVFSPGSKSGEIIQKVNRIKGISATYTGDRIQIQVILPNGAQKPMPDIIPKEAAITDVRLSFTGNGTYKKAFLVKNFQKILVDDGPVLDMFAGKIPLNKGDYSIFIESLESRKIFKLSGITSYTLENDWICVEGETEKGRKTKFVVDFGAESTTLSKKSIAKGTEIIPLEMAEFSPEGKKSLDAFSHGASGKVENIAGIAYLDILSLGKIEIPNCRVTVLNEFPKVFRELGVDGIIGRDILLKTDLLKIKNLIKSDGEQVLEFSESEKNLNGYTYMIPFRFAGGHLFFEGTINGSKIDFLFDSGAGGSWISKDFLNSNNVPYIIEDTETKIAYGIDGKGIEYKITSIKNVCIHPLCLDNMAFNMSDIFVLENIGLVRDAALLGMNFLRNYRHIAFDFTENP